MGHWCNWPLVVWAFIAIFLLSSFYFLHFDLCEIIVFDSYPPVTPALPVTAAHYPWITLHNPYFWQQTFILYQYFRERATCDVCGRNWNGICEIFDQCQSLSVSLSLSPCNPSCKWYYHNTEQKEQRYKPGYCLLIKYVYPRSWAAF